MGDELTRDQVKRDDFLRDLASDPQKALRHWKRLKPREDIVVIYYMTLTYGHTFAQHFKKEADRDKRPDLHYSVTNRARCNSRNFDQARIQIQGVAFEAFRRLALHVSLGSSSRKRDLAHSVGQSRTTNARRCQTGPPGH